MVEILGSIALWTRTLVGVMKLLDWLLSQKQKKTLASWAAATWIWLDDQRIGKFISVVQNKRAQQCFSLITHIIVALALLSFVGRAYLGWAGSVEIYIGTPRLHLFQVWVDLAAILLSMMVLSLYLHPRITAWIAKAPSVFHYFLRTGIATILAYSILRVYISGLFWVGLPAGQGTWDGSKFVGPAFFAPGTDADYGGRLNVIVLHTVTAMFGAPALLEALLLIGILCCSMGWLVLIWVLYGLHVAAKFLVLRIAEHKDGPVLALSALLVALGAIVKIFIP